MKTASKYLPENWGLELPSSDRRASLKQPDQIDDQNNDHHQLQHKRAALVELVDHEAVEFFGGVDFLVDQVLVVGDADLQRGDFIEASGEHVAQELDGVVGALGQFSDIEQDGMQSAGAFRGAPARGDAHRTVFHEIVDALQFAGQQFVVVAEFEELRVGVFQQLNHGFRARRRVVEKRGVPADHGQVVWIVRDLRLHDFLLLAVGERNVFAADDLGDASTLGRKQFGRRRITRDVTHVEDEVIFVQPTVVKLDQSRARAFDLLFDDLLREAGEIGVPNPTAGEADQRVPVASKGQLEDHAEHAVIVVLDLDVEPFAAFEDQRLDRFDHWRTLETDVPRSRMLEASLLPPSSEDVAQGVELDLLANVELDQHQHRPLQGLVLSDSDRRSWRWSWS